MKNRLIAKRFFEVITMLMYYESCEETQMIEKRVAELLCDMCTNNKGECTLCTDDLAEARMITTASDGIMLENTNPKLRSTLMDIKMEVLTENKIVKLKKYDRDLFKDRLESAAYAGRRDACELLAALCWLGIAGFDDKKKAISVWEMLAISGDDISMQALIYALGKSGEEEKYLRWHRISELIKEAREHFSPVAGYGSSIECSDDEIGLSNIILMLCGRGECDEPRVVDRAMIYYISNSEDDCITKMKKLASTQNFYPLIMTEEKQKNKKYGF